MPETDPPLPKGGAGSTPFVGSVLGATRPMSQGLPTHTMDPHMNHLQTNRFPGAGAQACFSGGGHLSQPPGSLPLSVRASGTSNMFASESVYFRRFSGLDSGETHLDGCGASHPTSFDNLLA